MPEKYVFEQACRNLLLMASIIVLVCELNAISNLCSDFVQGDKVLCYQRVPSHLCPFREDILDRLENHKWGADDALRALYNARLEELAQAQLEEAMQTQAAAGPAT
jgi:hypothetical protein